MTVCLIWALTFVSCAYSAVPRMKIYLVHIGDIVKRWKLEYDVLLQHTNVDSFSSMLRSDLLHDDGRSELHGMELFSSITSQYEALTNDRLQKSIHTSQPEHLLIHLNVYKDQKGAQLCILGRKFNTSHGLSIGNRIIKIKEQEKAELGTGLVSWDGAVVLAKYLEKNFDLVNGKLVLELGAGTGIAGLAAWLLGAGEVSLTDLPYTIDNLHVNIQATREANEFPFSMHNIVAHKLDWTDPRTYPAQGQYDVLLGADIVWLEHLVDPLVRTIAHIIGSEGIMLLAHQTRSLRTDDALFGALDSASMAYQQIAEDSLAEGYRPNNIKVYLIRASRIHRSSRTL